MVTLYVSHESGMLGKNAQSLYYRPSRSGKAENIPAHLIDEVLILGRGSISTPAMHLLMEKNIPVHFIDGSGHYKGSLTSGRGRGYAAKRLQFEAACSEVRSLHIVRSIVSGKLLSQRKTLIRYRNRNFQGDKELHGICEELSYTALKAQKCNNIEKLRGLEGIGAAAYFSVFGKVLKEPWFFSVRSRRPPLDPVNALLSFGYTLLLSHVTSALCISGLDPCVGFLHPEYRGRPSLALDLMEEFRSPVVDRLVVAMLNQGRLRPEQFSVKDDGGVCMREDARKIFIQEYSKRLDNNAVNEVNGQSSSFRKHILNQSQAFLKALRDDENYSPLSIAAR